MILSKTIKKEIINKRIKIKIIIIKAIDMGLPIDKFKWMILMNNINKKVIYNFKCKGRY